MRSKITCLLLPNFFWFVLYLILLFSMSRLTTSKFRNLKGIAFKREAWYPDLNVSNSTTEGTIVSASPLWISVLWGTPTGGSLGILGHGDFGKRKRNVPLIHAHPQPVNDFQWNPYFDWHLATASTDATVKLWKLPEDGLSDDLTVPDATLKGQVWLAPRYW